MMQAMISPAALGAVAYTVVFLAPALMAALALLARWQASLGRGLAVLLCLLVVLAGMGALFASVLAVAAASWLMPGLLRLDALAGVMLALSGFIGAVILHYSTRYLAGNPRAGRYMRQLMLTLAAVWVLVSSNHLLVLVLAWCITDYFLHGLLTFFNERPAAVLAARKRLLAVIPGNVCLLAASLLIHHHVGSFALDAVARHVAAAGMSPGLALAAFLLASGVILKSALLPVHGWILQVMEAPTPVSALLHAGIVNIGGYVLLRFSGLIEAAPAAQALLVVAGVSTACLAALVMMTRVSIKVMLAWSTCAQMGFMLLEIGLGAYALALLHLLAHSLYKAHAFLAAGATARRVTLLRGLETPAAVPLQQRLAGLAWTLALLAAAVLLSGLDPLSDPRIAVLALVLLTGLSPMLRVAASHGRLLLSLSASVAALVLLYGVWHHLFEHLLPSARFAPAPGLLVFTAAGLLGLWVIQEYVIAFPASRFARWLRPRAFAGFYLDEGMTRLVLAGGASRCAPSASAISSREPV